MRDNYWYRIYGALIQRSIQVKLQIRNMFPFTEYIYISINSLNRQQLAMDVREFVGGDVTVRTAGRTVSVRGKVDVKVGGTKVVSGGPKDSSSSPPKDVPSSESCAKTLHRRFQLPADADTDRVSSCLSRDAILSVTVPKKVNMILIFM